MRKAIKIGIGIVGLLIIIPFVYLAYDRSLMPPKPEWTSPAFIPRETWQKYATRFLATSKKPNALEHYLNAFSLASVVYENKAWYSIETIMQFGWKNNYLEVNSLLDLNKTALQEIMLGTKMNQCELPPMPYSLSAPMPNLIAYGSLGNQLTVTGLKLESMNKPKDALQYYLSGIQFGKDMGQKDQELVVRAISFKIILNYPNRSIG
jgi:hypothetical protein